MDIFVSTFNGENVKEYPLALCTLILEVILKTHVDGPVNKCQHSSKNTRRSVTCYCLLMPNVSNDSFHGNKYSFAVVHIKEKGKLEKSSVLINKDEPLVF